MDAIASPDSGFGLNAAMSGFSVSSAMIGCVVGAWFAGTLADRIGRVRVMQLAAALFVFSALFTGLASNIWVFVIFRIVGDLASDSPQPSAPPISPRYRRRHAEDSSPASNRWPSPWALVASLCQ